jgi:hypothetical protein
LLTRLSIRWRELATWKTGGYQSGVASKKRVAILLHETDPYPRLKVHFIWALADLWQHENIEIQVLKGPNEMIDADLLIPHIDLTVLPDAYGEQFRRSSRVVNRNVRDISKRVISRNLLARDEPFDGPVIVKTDLNYGGIPEARINGTLPKPARKRAWSILAWTLKSRSRDPNWADVKVMDTSEYRIFPSVKAVPEAAFSNPALVVERFLPERENGRYHLRIYQFLGDCGYCARLGSTEPIVKMKSVMTREEIPVPEEMIALRHELGLDYGKMDFVLHEGRVVLLDVNRTPGLINPPERMQASALRLAPGIHAFL